MKHGLEILDSALDAIGKSLDREMSVYLIGGGALAFRKIKESTKDVDMIFEKEGELESFAATLRKQGFTTVHRDSPAYNKARNMLEKTGSPSFDLFYEDVCGGLHFTESMKRRAEKHADYGKLSVHLVSNEDIFLFKAVAGREGDLDDCAELVKTGVDWEIVLGELEKQGLVTKKEWAAQFAHFLDELHAKYRITIPVLERVVEKGERELIRHLIHEMKKQGKAKKEIINELGITGEEYQELA